MKTSLRIRSRIYYLKNNIRSFWHEKIRHTNMTKCPECKHKTLIVKFSTDYCSRKRCDYSNSKRGNMFTGGIPAIKIDVKNKDI